MKTITLFFIAILGIAIQSHAQCFVLKVYTGDCPLHVTRISMFDPMKTGLPAFVVYPVSSREDSADIEYAGKFSIRGIKLLFNDNWNEKLNCSNGLSCIFGLDKDGKVVYTSSLNSIDSTQFSAFLLKNTSQKSDLVRQRDSFIYVKNEFGTIKILNAADNRLIRTLRAADLDLQLVANKMPAAEKLRFEKYGNIINKRTGSFLAKFQNFRITDKGDLFVMLLFHNTQDSLTTNITDEHAIVHYDAKGNYKDVYLLELPKTVYFFDIDFLLANEDTLYAVTRNGKRDIDPQMPESDIKFIGQYVKKGGNYRFSGFIPYKMPYIYQLKFGYGYLGSGTSTYPFFVPKLSNTVYNIKTNRSVFIIDSAKYIAGIDTTPFNAEKSIETHEKLDVRGIKPVLGQSDLYVMPYLYDGKLYINYYTTDLAKKYGYCWGQATVAGKPIVSASARDGQDVFSVIYADKDKAWKSIALPLSLFFPAKGD